MNKNNELIIKSAAEYIEELSKKTITPITYCNINANKVILCYDDEEHKNKADDHGTTELLKEMFFKYLYDNGFAANETPEISFKFKSNVK